MFGVRVPAAADVRVEIRVVLGRGTPHAIWEGTADCKDADIANEILENKNTVAYLWKGVEKGRLKADELGLYAVPVRIVATQGKEIVVDERATVPLVLPSEQADRDLASHQLLREFMSLCTTAILGMQKTATDAIATVTDHSATALREVAVASKDLHKAGSDAMSTVSGQGTTVLRDMASAHQTTLKQAHDALTTIAQSADKLSGLADKIFDDSRERAAALVHEVRKNGQAGSKVSDGLKDLKSVADLMMTFKAVTEDKDHGGKK